MVCLLKISAQTFGIEVACEMNQYFPPSLLLYVRQRLPWDLSAAWLYLSKDYSARPSKRQTILLLQHQTIMKTRIKEYQAKYNLTQEKLAEVVGVRQETIIFLEQGKYNPSLKLAHSVAKALQTTIDEIFIFDD